jgi:hypothetical protein
MNIKRIDILVAIGLVLVPVWFIWRHHNKKQDATNSVAQLKPQEKEALIIDPIHHSIITVTAKGTQKTFLPDRPSRISIDKNGAVIVTARTYGTELEPFIGFAFSDTGRLALGGSLLYYHSWDLGLALFPTVSGPFSVRVGPVVSYNLYDNTSLFLGITDKGGPVGGLSLRF